VITQPELSSVFLPCIMELKLVTRQNKKITVSKKIKIVFKEQVTFLEILRKAAQHINTPLYTVVDYKLL
jgi:hypothetical protein